MKKINLIILFFIIFWGIFSCSESSENHYSKATNLRGPEPAPVITVEEITSGGEWDEYEYQIKNTGNLVLKLTSLPIVEITGENESEFSIIQQPLYQEIGPGLSLNFKIKFNPKSEGAKTANIEIPNNSNNTPFVCSIGKNAQQYTLTINPNPYNRGNAIPSITFFNEIETTITASPKSGFYHYKWEIISGNITINQPRSSTTQISVKNSNAVIEPVIYTFDPSQAPGINLEEIYTRDYYHDYAFIDAHINWADARSFCQANGGHLATITSLEENNFVCGNMTIDAGWLGGYRSNSDPNVFYWITGEDFDDYENWDGPNNEPQNDEDRIVMRKNAGNGNWFGNKEDDKFAIICEWD